MVDALATIETVLAGWTAGNTDSITPTIGKVYDYSIKELDYNNKDYVLVHTVSEITEPFGIGGTSFKLIATITVDIRTTYKNAAMSAVRAHMVKMRDEVIRLFKAATADPDANFQLLSNFRERDLSDKSWGIGRITMDVDLKAWGT